MDLKLTGMTRKSGFRITPLMSWSAALHIFFFHFVTWPWGNPWRCTLGFRRIVGLLGCGQAGKSKQVDWLREAVYKGFNHDHAISSGQAGDEIHSDMWPRLCWNWEGMEQPRPRLSGGRGSGAEQVLTKLLTSFAMVGQHRAWLRNWSILVVPEWTSTSEEWPYSRASWRQLFVT